MRFRFLPAVVLALTVCGAPPAATASSVGFDEGGIQYTAAPGEYNRLTFVWEEPEPPVHDFRDSVSIAALDGCSNARPRHVRCPGGREVPVTVMLGDGDDTLRLGGSTGNFRFAGGPGVDTFDLEFDPATGPYFDGTGAFRISLDDLPNDGRAGQASNIGSDVENVRGSLIEDVIAGNSFDNELAGGTRADRIDAHGGDDTIDLIDAERTYGRHGEPTTKYRLDRDHAECGAGTDVVRADTVDRVARDCERVRVFVLRTRTVYEEPVTDLVLDHVVLNGTDRADVLRGNLRKPNRIFPRRGNDHVFGGRRDDRVHARGFGTDVVHCGRGEDRVRADARDEVAGDCETIRRG
jgi:hypothetical protein